MKPIVVFFTDLNTRMDTHIGKKGPEHPSQQKGWISKRAALWRRCQWTMAQRQTDSDWMYVMRCHPKAKKITDGIFRNITDKRFYLSYINTQQEIDVIKRISELGRPVICIRCDSDDMYHKDAIRDVLTDERDLLWWCWKRGYAYQFNTGALFRYNTIGVGPFFAHKFKDPVEFGKLTTFTHPQHTLIKKKCPGILPHGRFIVGIGMNSSTHMGNKHIGARFRPKQASRILKDFGWTKS